MNWGDFKQVVDNAILEELGAGFDHDQIEIDYIDVDMVSDPAVVIDTSDLDNIRMSVTE